jgi:two-component system CheB/CheR fusion protein
MNELDQSTTIESNGAEPAEFVENDRLAEPIGVEAPPRLPFPVVGMGASAGGLEAFIEFFDAMPSDAGIAFVLVQHLPPERESMVADILSKHTQMPTHEVEDGMPVEPNHVYVIRPGRTLTIKGGRLHLGERLSAPGHHRPVDDFFRSLAEEQRQRAICVILSGMGSNGSSGAESIKAVGGLAIAQSPESAKFPSMPRHLIESGNADFVHRPEEIPKVLVRYVWHAYVRGGKEPSGSGETEDLKALGEVLSVLRARIRRDFTGYKKPTVLRRIQRRMGLNQIESLPQYARFLRQTPAEIPALSDDLMIHVTGFFRDAAAWEALQDHVMKPLMAEREAEGCIRCWVTACSSGEEAYTLSMLLWEAAEATGKDFDIKVFATDMAERSLAKARLGIYPLGIEAEIEPARLERFFERDDSVYRIRKELREMVVFAPQNVLQDPPFSRLDICTCRNLLIYLEPEVQRRVLSLLHFGLRQGGALFLGSSETIVGVEELFEPIDKKARIFRRVAPARHGAVEFAFPNLKTAATDPAPTRAAPRVTVAQLTQRALLDRYTPPAVTVDREQRILYFHGDTTAYLQQPTGEPTRELLPLVRETLRGTARLALQQALAENQKASARDGIIDGEEGRYRLEVTAEPIEPKSATNYFLVTFDRIKESADHRAAAGEPSHDDRAELEAELIRVRDELQSTIEELQTTNEEMRASNEETMSINEELQSTNEELETNKEELQSLNEELTTVNVQLQTKMEEHEATSNDLSSLLTSTDVAVVFLDPGLRIRRYTPAVRDLVELIPADVGRPLADLHLKFDDCRLLTDCQAVVEKLTPVEREVTSADSGQIYMRRVQPYRTLDNRIEGVVLTFIDVTALKRAEKERRRIEERFRQVIEGAQDFAMMLLDAQGNIVTWSEGATRLLGWSKEEAIGHSASMIYAGEDPAGQLAEEMETAIRQNRAADETWHQRKDGSRFWGRGVLTALRDEDGGSSAFVKVMRDETARRDAEISRDHLLVSEQSARRDAEQSNVVKDQFLARLSHELRTPLSSITTWAELLQDNIDDSTRQEGLRVIQRSAEAQAQLLNDLLEISRIASGKMRLQQTRRSLAEVIRQAVEAMLPGASQRGVALEMEAAQDPFDIAFDPDRIRQVVSNLLTNAVKFTPAGGRIDVKLSRVDNFAEIRVTDTGHGIDPGFLPYIFTPFSQADYSMTRNYGGLGLGLAICKELVELHGGTIEAQSEGFGRGATIVVRLPTGQATSAEYLGSETAVSRPAQDALAGIRILLVEDDSATNYAVRRMLEQFGASVAATKDASEAYEQFVASSPEVFLSDIGLPNEDGLELLKRIRALEKERGLEPAPAIAITAFAGVQHQREAQAAGFQDYLSKPVKTADLIAAILRVRKA